MSKGRGKKMPKKMHETLLAKSRERDASQSRQYWKDREDGIAHITHPGFKPAPNRSKAR